MQTMDEVGKNKDVLLISREGERERGGRGGAGEEGTVLGKGKREVKLKLNAWTTVGCISCETDKIIR